MLSLLVMYSREFVYDICFIVISHAQNKRKEAYSLVKRTNKMTGVYHSGELTFQIIVCLFNFKCKNSIDAR